MNKLAKALTAGSVLAVAGLAQAGEISGNVTLTNDYVFRGLTQNDREAAIQGGFDYEHESGAYVGVWASNADLNNELTPGSSTVEIDWYGGYAFEVSGVGIDVGLLYYNYPDATKENDTLEYNLGFGYGVGQVDLGLSFAYSTDFFSLGEESLYTLVSADVALPYDVGLSLSIGNQYVDNEDDYNDYYIGFSKSVCGVDLGAAFAFTDGYNSTDRNDEESFIFSISKSL